MNRLTALPVLCAVLALVTWLGTEGASGGSGDSSAETFVAQLGDRIRVSDAPIACRVVRVRELDRRIALDCRRGGPLPGSYGTLLTAREAAVVRFETARVAKLVSVAAHDRELRRCR